MYQYFGYYYIYNVRSHLIGDRLSLNVTIYILKGVFVNLKLCNLHIL